MQISMSFSGTLAHPARARQLEQKLHDLAAELQETNDDGSGGLTGTLSISDTEKYEPK